MKRLLPLILLIGSNGWGHGCRVAAGTAQFQMRGGCKVMTLSEAKQIVKAAYPGAFCGFYLAWKDSRRVIKSTYHGEAISDYMRGSRSVGLAWKNAATRILLAAHAKGGQRDGNF
jgi:hypothetical protein